MTTTYTDFKLTDAMLQRLSKICNGRPAGGMSTRALRDRGLVETDESFGYPTDRPTPMGEKALADARREGW